jgi:hypothetical protein
MILSARDRQRADDITYAEHLAAFLRGEDTPEAIAGGIELVPLVRAARKHLGIKD